MLSPQLHGFPGTTIIISGDEHCPNHSGMDCPWVDLETHQAAATLAALPFSLWHNHRPVLLTHQQLLCVLVSASPSAWSGPEQQPCDFGKPRGASRKGQRGWSWLRVLTPNPKPWGPDLISQDGAHGASPGGHRKEQSLPPLSPPTSAHSSALAPNSSAS